MTGKKKTSILVVAFVIILYIFSQVSVINWGLPNSNHPFTYHMDEWHQLVAVKGVYKNFSNNIPGAAHGPMFQFLLTGVYLAPFYLLHVVDPFRLKTGFDLFDLQQRLFIILRLNSLLFGVLSLVVLHKIAAKYFKISPLLTVMFFTVTPIWITLSNYFKYDIALIFWILLAILWMMKYRDSPTAKNYFFAGGLCGLALATKISAIPLVPIYVLSYFLFTKKGQWDFLNLIKGLFVIFIVFSLVGIPDVYIHFRKAGYFEFFYSNLISAPQGSGNFILPIQLWLFLIFYQYPILFGHGFFFLIFFAFIYGMAAFFRLLRNKTLFKYKSEIFILLCFSFFALSLVILKIASSGNRALILLPFFAIGSTMVIKNVLKNFPKFRPIVLIFLSILLSLQILESLAWLSIKLLPDPRHVASVWILKNIPKGKMIGLENIPIYQMIPDVTLEEFYIKQNFPKRSTIYDYVVIDRTTRKLPPYIIITAAEFDERYLKTSAKKQLLTLLKEQGYKRTKYFPPNLQFYKFFGDELNFYLPNLVPQSSISIYKKDI